MAVMNDEMVCPVMVWVIPGRGWWVGARCEGRTSGPSGHGIRSERATASWGEDMQDAPPQRNRSSRTPLVCLAKAGGRNIKKVLETHSPSDIILEFYACCLCLIWRIHCTNVVCLLLSFSFFMCFGKTSTKHQQSAGFTINMCP